MTFGKFAGVKVIKWFLCNPSERIHFKKLCRRLKLGPPTVKNYCGEFVGKKWLNEERNANLRIFSLNNSNYVIKALKRAYFLELLRKDGIEKLIDGSAVSFALYGSHANGEYDERSDVDLLVIGRKEQVHYEQISALEEKMKKHFQLTVISLERWGRERQSNPFMLSILKNHVLIKGAAL
ncbi:DNA polymerase subunit beta [Candidatus Micrarchaeota archaeon CG11_big_fil_rev_8_21_14_0_20_47_5]|nr:MAG: hypothetical protein AUJ17_00530 [Candidatus Micrarchaeota archaeon CG1_02_47_40]PIN82580.1 MAG: DNA polymerase subunit beta [Candidatus Micrarchaeota archaeon CG11_big_fil_rev_8_21_14_0_20_47_5]